MSWMRIASVALATGFLVASHANAEGWSREFDEAEVLVEINATDGDAGFQGKLDGEPWSAVKLIGPDRRRLFDVRLRGSAAKQGLTEFVWESAEPTFDVFGLAEFLERFPEGEYRFRGRPLERGFLHSTAELTHQLPAGPVILSPEEGATVPSGEDLEIRWQAVTTQFAIGDPNGESSDPLESEVVRYIVVAEFEDEDEDIKEVLSLEVEVLEGDGPIYSATIPASFMRFADSDGYKVEVGAVEESGNRTFIERPICTDIACPEDADEE